uniref:Uncharacterized protein n=1 Tax=Mola mola TaxID=94237 RepID=A0A3Q3WGU0_MOLML
MMEHLENSTASLTQSSAGSQADASDGNAYLYILIVLSFYGVFLCGILLGYFRSIRREKRRTNVFTRLVHEEEQREWGALPKKHSLPFPAAVSGLRSVHVTLDPLDARLGLCVTRSENTSSLCVCLEMFGRHGRKRRGRFSGKKDK